MSNKQVRHLIKAIAEGNISALTAAVHNPYALWIEKPHGYEQQGTGVVIPKKELAAYLADHNITFSIVLPDNNRASLTTKEQL